MDQPQAEAEPAPRHPLQDFIDKVQTRAMTESEDRRATAITLAMDYYRLIEVKPVLADLLAAANTMDRYLAKRAIPEGKA